MSEIIRPDRINNDIVSALIKNISKDVMDMDKLNPVIEELSHKKMNILFAGATGAGKSSTINTLFDKEVATVGNWTDPETTVIDHYQIGTLTLWDSPGLGDNPEKDRKYANAISKLLVDKDENGDYLIDAVVVVVDSSSKDMGTVFEMINQLIKPYLGDDKRIILALNKCDFAMSGRHWNNGMPDPVLTKELEEKCIDVKNRLYTSTGIKNEPVYYSAEYKYNISRLLYAIINAVPDEKRYLLAPSLNKSTEIWAHNDNKMDYNQEIGRTFKGSLGDALQGAAKGAAAGAAIGSLIPGIGTVTGAVIGTVLGGVSGLFGI